MNPPEYEGNADPEATPATGPSSSPQASEEPTEFASSSRPSSLPALPIPEPGSMLAGRYMVLERLGQGGMGVVLAAYDSRLDRRVALKLLHASAEAAGEGTSAPGARLLREAQAMARLNHPHVVHVYDAGSLEDGRIFIAMEYVRGQTLRSWRQDRQHTWREVLGAYLEAGRGLAAAHAAGLVHRDFKPDNVLVGEDGRVRVTDFGVARAESFPSSFTPSPVPLPVQPEAWESALTLPGMVVGTPKYLAPELLEGKPADARSDLFAFCVALYEALYGQSAFSGASHQERLRAQHAGRVQPPPAQSQVPAWVAREVLRGLQAQPQLRHPSMLELVAALESDPEVRRRSLRRTAAVASVGVALVGLAVWGWVRQQQQGPTCAGMERRLAGVWDAAVKAQAQKALLATGLPYARDTFQRVAAALDEEAVTWVRMKVEACEAALQQAPSPRSLPVLQDYCLERRRSQVRALTELLARGPDKELVSRAVQAVQSLPPLADCADARVLTAAVPPPEDPAVRKQADALNEQVDRLEALFNAGKYKEGLALGQGVLEQVRVLGHAPLQARALHAMAELSDGAGDYKGAESFAREAIVHAAKGKEDVLAARAWSLLHTLVGARQARHAEAQGLELMLQAAVERAEGDKVRAKALSSLGNLLEDMGQYEQARAHYERALALAQKVHGPEHPSMATMLSRLASVFQHLGQYEQARGYLERALRVCEKALGPEHPNVASLHNNLGSVLQDLGQYEQALVQHERALALKQKVLGPEHPSMANSYNNLGLTYQELGQYEKAREQHERALALKQKVLGPEHPSVADSLNNLAMAFQGLNQPAQAREYYERALALQQRVLGPEHPSVLNAFNNLGVHSKRLGQYAQALDYYERALALGRKALGPEHPLLASTLSNMGNVFMLQGQYAQAREHYERALALEQKTLGPDHPDVANSLLNLGNLHLEQGQYALAQEHYERALGVLQRASTPDSSSLMAELKVALGHSLVHLGRLDEAGRLFEGARAVVEQHAKTEPWLLGEALLGQGELHLARRQPSEARALLERALPLTGDFTRTEVQWVLAQALWDTGQERPRARALATQAEAAYRQKSQRLRVAQVAQWLVHHRLP